MFQLLRASILLAAASLSACDYPGESPALLEAYNRSDAYYQQGQYSEARVSMRKPSRSTSAPWRFGRKF
jgi:hypothetical protein